MTIDYRDHARQLDAWRKLRRTDPARVERIERRLLGLPDPPRSERPDAGLDFCVGTDCRNLTDRGTCSTCRRTSDRPGSHGDDRGAGAVNRGSAPAPQIFPDQRSRLEQHHA